MCCCNHHCHCHGWRTCYPNATVRCWSCGTYYYPGFTHMCRPLVTWTTTTHTGIGSTTRLANTVARLAG